MDPATVFLLYAIGLLLAWLLATLVRPAVVAMSRMGTVLPIGRPVMALVVSSVLLFGIVRVESASGSVGPASHRMEQMADFYVGAPPDSPDVVSQFHPMMPSSTTHVVVKGDSLWRIARFVLSADDPEPAGASISELWRSIYELNRDVIGEDPNLILPGQILQLPGR